MLTPLLLVFLGQVFPANCLPDPAQTPGLTDSRLTLQVLTAPEFRTGKYRAVTLSMKEQVCKVYSVPWSTHSQYEIDHLIPIELGGAEDTKNLWPEPYHGPWNAHMKDELEDKLRFMLVHKQVDLYIAQNALAHNWIAAYQHYVRTDYTHDLNWSK